jgi:hypothetical protein
MTTFFQGQNATFFANFVDGASNPILQGISGTQISIYHYIGPSQVIDLAPTAMNQDLVDTNRFYYTYQFGTAAATTDYLTTYNALFSGLTVQSTEVNNLLPGSTTIPGSIVTGGSVTASGLVVDISGNTLYNTQIVMASGNTLYASTTTDASGNYTVSIDPGYYLFTASKTGYSINQTFKTIPNTGPTFFIGTTVLNYQVISGLSFYDTLVSPSPNNPAVSIPLVNLKVRLYDNLGNPPMMTVYTDVSGTFTLMADPGRYIVDIEGMRSNGNSGVRERFKLTRNIEVDSMYPNNFDYLDTSKGQFI